MFSFIYSFIQLFIFKVHFGFSHQLSSSLMTHEKGLYLVFSLFVFLLCFHGFLSTFIFPYYW